MSGILGVDPGVNGAAALYEPHRTAASGLRWTVIDLPMVEGGLDVPAFRDWLRRYSPDHAFLEWVSPMKGWGTIPSFRLGTSYGQLRATLACVDIPTSQVTPTSWKRALGLLKAGKDAGRVLALDLFPDQAAMLQRKKDHNRADSLLIAHYGACKLGMFRR